MGSTPDDVVYALTSTGRAYYDEHPDLWISEFKAAAESFREFLRYWKFVDQDTGVIRTLGDELWSGQEEFIAAVDEQPWMYALKARQLGFTTIECAYDGWVARFRDGGQNCRVHIYSKRDNDACKFLERVKFGLTNLPEQMRLPYSDDTVHELHLLGAEENDTRVIIAYPADNDTSRGFTSNHAHVDEWAAMGDPKKVWGAIEPAAAGTVHIITTGVGPESYTAVYWLRCMAGDAVSKSGERVRAFFTSALNRPDRSAAWLLGKKSSMDELEYRREYAMTWQDALFGGGDFIFKPSEIEACGQDFRGLGTVREGRKYVKAWDIGRHQDAAVGICLDITEDVHDVVAYVRLRGVRYPFIQREIQVLHHAFPGITVIEKNSAGEAVMENLEGIHEEELVGFSTTGASKPRIIQGLVVAVQNQCVKWDPNACSQLNGEMTSYQIPDDNVVQDSVVTLAIAEAHAGLAHLSGRLLDITRW